MTIRDDELERLRAAFAAPQPRAESAPNPESCPEPDRIWQTVRGELPPEDVREIVDHVAVCASCAEDWRIAVAFDKESDARQFPARRLQPWIAAAAAALVLTVGGFYFRQTQKPGPAAYRGSPTGLGSLAGETIPRQAFVLSWTPVEGAESYDLLVTTSELVTIADRRGLATTEYQVPARALADLPAAARLHWRVTAVFPDGERKQSPTFTVVLE